MRVLRGSLGTIVLTLAVLCGAGPASAASLGRVHLSELARRLFASDKVNQLPEAFGEYFHQPKDKLFAVPPRAKRPSAFERGLERHWQPEALERNDFLAGFERKGTLPARFPWNRPLRGKAEYLESGFFRAAVLEFAAESADKNGYVDLGRLSHQFGHTKYEQEVKKALLHPVPKDALFNPEHTTWNNLLEYLDQATLQKMTGTMARQLVPKDMRALGWVQKRYDPQRVLGGVRRVWARQHVLGNTLGFLEATGLPAERMDIWGKAYSLDPRIAPTMTREGYHVHGDGLDRKAIEAQVDAELRKIPDPSKHTKPEFLLLDDGGELIRIIADHVQRKWPAYAHLFSAVEQTKGGINRLKKTPLPFPVVASGSSWGKERYGSAMFGYAVAREIEAKLEKLAPMYAAMGLPERKRMTVLGYGPMGSTIAKHFRDEGREVVVYDVDPAKREQARKDGIRAVAKKADALENAEILVSATGRTAFRHASFAHLPSDAIVFNAGSSNELPRIGEFHGESTLNGLPRFHDDAYLEAKDTTRTMLFKNPKDAADPIPKMAHFIKDGGVINFPLEVGNPRAGQLVPGRYIQFQLGLLYLDVLSAMKGGHRAGFIDTPKQEQRELVDYVQADLARTGESLKQPRWE